MSSESKKSSKKNVASQAGDFAKNIWLAGLGAYGRAFDEAQERYDSASKEAPRLFTELVEKGKKFESTARSKITESPLMDTKQSIEERISKMRSGMGFGSGVSHDDLKRLEKKVDLLTKKVDQLASAKGSPDAPSAKVAKPVKAPAAPRKLAAKKPVEKPSAE